MTTQDTVDVKKLYKSKTFWASLITAGLPFVPFIGPVASAWVAANPELFSVALGALFGGLRVVTKDQVVIK